MSKALQKVSDYMTEARILLQDTISPYRYSDDSLINALNLALLEGRRIRPDLFVFFKCNADGGVQYFNPANGADNGQEVEIEAQFRQAFLNGMVGYAIERDQEDLQDNRSVIFLGFMRYMLTGQKPPTTQARAAAVAQPATE